MEFTVLVEELEKSLAVGKSFDIGCRRFRAIGGRCRARFYGIAGFIHTEMAEKLLSFAVSASTPAMLRETLPYPEVSFSETVSELTDAVMTGRGVLVVEGLSEALILDIKNYPMRGIEEPENDRVLRGPRDGFGEVLVRNTSLIRRHLRDPKLIFERITVGDPAKTDVVLGYVDGKADPAFVAAMREKLTAIQTPSLNMSQESLAECLVPRGWYNPFPKVRYTERPDAAAAMLEEGSVVVLCDNTPQVMILPTSIFDFLQETDDFYLPPLIGTYLRLTRMLIFGLSLIVTPLWYLLVKNAAVLPAWLRFVEIKEPAAVPLLLQLLLAEFMIDGLKLASLNTPNTLSNTLSVVGGLILGDYAVQAGWFSSQTILYMAIVSIAAFTQQSYELGYAFKFFRILFLLLVAWLNGWGLFLGLLIFLIIVASNRSVRGSRSYLYPLIPFQRDAFLRLLVRRKKKP
ncbi:MAG: spore germination protein [Ruminococcaceae bacterium]|nr:spore germination protein [Oscillospiraceae bacterium]